MENQNRRHSLFWPVLLIAVGIVLFLNNVGAVSGNTWDVLIRLWPLLFIVGGLDGLYRGEGFVSSVIGVGLGALLLMTTLGYLGLSVWELVLRLWPVLIIGWGLDLIIGRRGAWSPWLGILVGILLIAGIIWITILAPINPQGSLVTREIGFALKDTSAASGSINVPAGRLNLDGSSTSDLVQGVARLSSTENLDQNVSYSGRDTNFRLEGRGMVVMLPSTGAISQYGWDLHLNPAVTYDLTIKMGAGEQMIDLSQLKVSRADINLGAGKAVVSLPTKGSGTFTIKTAVGETVLRIPRDAAVRIRVNRALTVSNVPPELRLDGKTYTTANYASATERLEVEMEQAVGALSIQYLP